MIWKKNEKLKLFPNLDSNEVDTEPDWAHTLSWLMTWLSCHVLSAQIAHNPTRVTCQTMRHRLQQRSNCSNTSVVLNAAYGQLVYSFWSHLAYSQDCKQVHFDYIQSIKSNHQLSLYRGWPNVVTFQAVCSPCAFVSLRLIDLVNWITIFKHTRLNLSSQLIIEPVVQRKRDADFNGQYRFLLRFRKLSTFTPRILLTLIRLKFSILSSMR